MEGRIDGSDFWMDEWTTDRQTDGKMVGLMDNCFSFYIVEGD